MKLLLLNGPNLNMLGQREPGLYGNKTLPQIEDEVIALASGHGMEVECLQTNSEGGMVDAIQRAGAELDGVILNAAAYTHTSVAVRDAVLACGIPVLEVHLTNPHARESFRRVSMLSGAAKGVIAGFGAESYALAVLWFARNK